MFRKIVCALFALAICVGIVLADEVKGKVEKVDGEKGSVSVKVEGKEKAASFKVGKDTKVVDADGKDIGVKDIKAGDTVTVTYEKGDKEKKIPAKVTSIKVSK